MKFASIVPTEYVYQFHTCIQPSCNLVLAHIVESDKEYRRLYRNFTSKDRFTIMDNSVFEMYTQNKPAFPSEKLLNLAEQVGASYIVLPDFPGVDSNITIDAAIEYAAKFKEVGFKTFFVPQGQMGNIEQWISSFAWASCSPLIDYIGISIIAVPNAYDIPMVGSAKLQNFVSRYMLMRELYYRGLLNLAKQNGKKIHMLGMNEGPNEINLMDSFEIDSWDSSAPAWAGLNGIKFDKSPTGLLDGKLHKPVDFSFKTKDNSLIECAKYNLGYINKLVEEYNERHPSA